MAGLQRGREHVNLRDKTAKEKTKGSQRQFRKQPNIKSEFNKWGEAQQRVKYF